MALIFFGPLVLAWVLYYSNPVTPASDRTNAGELLTPARPLPELALSVPGGGQARTPFREQWTLLVVAPDGCARACLARLADTRQIRVMMHRRSTRVQRMLVTGDAADAALTEDGHPDLTVLVGGERLTKFMARAGAKATGPGVIHLIDPLGNWVLYYPPGTRADAVFKDLKHLLKLSHIG